MVLLVAILSVLGASATRADADDAQIRLRILNRLKGQVDVNPRDLEVKVRSGEVELAGSVASLGELRKVDRLVYGIVGVDSVANNLGIRPTNRSSGDIQAEIINELIRRPRYRNNRISVTVSGRVVTLAGEVARAVDRSDAAEIAEMVEGVVQVDNRITVAATEETSPEEIRRRALAILGNPLTFGVIRDLEIEVDGSTVLIRGQVRRRADKLEASRLVLAVPGVVEVVNQLEVLDS